MMRKLGKKFSFMTKIMLVIGLLFSNLAPLKVVFAYEKSEAVVITKTTDNKLNIRYTEEVEDINLDVLVDETYTYLDGTTLTASNSYADVTVEDLISEDGLTVETVLDDVKFDGVYNAVIKLERKLDEGSELVAVNEYVEDINLEVGMISKVFRGGVEVTANNGVYDVLNGDVVNSQLIGGGLAPTWEYLYNEIVYTGLELLEYVFTDEVNLSKHLYGEHAYENEIVISSEHFTEDMVYDIDLSLMYGGYALNDNNLNDSVVTNGYEDVIKFAGGSKNGTLYIYPDLNNGTRVVTAYDLIKIVSGSIETESNIKFVISDGVEELQDKYSEYVAASLEEVVTPEEFYADYVVDENYYITISCEDLTIRYNVLYFADVNGDKNVTLDDVLALIDKILGIKVADLTKDDVSGDKTLNFKDAVYLFEMINSKKLEVELGKEDGHVSARLEVVEDDIVSGDTFTVNYIVTVDEYSMNGISGIFSYDKDSLELVSVENKVWDGNNNKESFFYLGDEYLELGEPVVPEVTPDEGLGDTAVDEETTVEGDNATEGDDTTSDVELEYPEVEYVVVTAKFKAKKAGEHTVKVKENTYINGVNTLKLNNDSVETLVVVNASSDNSLKSLTIGGVEVELKSDVLDYELTFENEIEEVEVDAVVNHLMANVTSVVAPEKLVEGENTITISVEAENGDIKIYTVKVIREEAPVEEEEKEEKPVYNNVGNKNNNKDKDKEKEEDIIVDPEPEEDDEEEKPVKEDDGKLSRIIVIILILIVIAGLIYLIFRDENDDDDTKKANKEIDKLKDEKAAIDEPKVNNTKKTQKKDVKKERR